MPISVALNDSGDWDLSSGKGRIVDSVAQRITTATKLFLGEDRYDSSKGFPWFEEIFKGKIPPAAFAARLKTYWLSLPGVTSVDSIDISIDPKTRLATVSAKFNGGTTVEIVI